MIRSLLASVWIVSVTLAAAYFGHTMQSSRPAPVAEQDAKASTTVKIKSMTVPVIAGGALQGYVLTELSISAKSDLLKTLPQPPELLLSDEVFKTLYAEEQVDFKHIEKTDLAKLSQKIRDNINSRAGAVIAEDVFIQELHYMSKEDVRAESQTSPLAQALPRLSALSHLGCLPSPNSARLVILSSDCFNLRLPLEPVIKLFTLRMPQVAILGSRVEIARRETMMFSPRLRVKTLVTAGIFGLGKRPGLEGAAHCGPDVESSPEARRFRDKPCDDARHPDPAGGGAIGEIERRQNRFDESFVSP